MTGKQSDRGYKRSWKNLLINKRYQLQFTLFMVGLSTLLMTGLGIWVMRVANETTTVSMASVRGTPCPKIPALLDTGNDKQDDDDVPTPSMKLPEPGEAPAPTEPAAPAVVEDNQPDPEKTDGKKVDEDERPHRATVTMDDSTITMLTVEPKLNPDFGSKVISHWTCQLPLADKIRDLERGRLLILWVLIGTGLLLVIGLAVYGIKMTHKVAGPLFKVSLYLAKMKEGRFDKVWNLRKGDQLVEFYEHFKTAHAGVVQMQKDDIAKLKAMIAAAEGANLGAHATVVEMRELLARKEKSIE